MMLAGCISYYQGILSTNLITFAYLYMYFVIALHVQHVLIIILSFKYSLVARSNRPRPVICLAVIAIHTSRGGGLYRRQKNTFART